MRVGKWQLFPLLVEPLKVYAGAATGENAEILSHIAADSPGDAEEGTWVLDRGFDRRELFEPLVKNGVAFVVRQRGDRTVRTADGRELLVDELVAEQTCPRPRRWPSVAVSTTIEVWLPEVGPDPFVLVIGWRVPSSERPLVLLVSPGARGGVVERVSGTCGRIIGVGVWRTQPVASSSTSRWSVLVRSWMSIRRLLWLVAWAFWWLNLWGAKAIRAATHGG